MNDINYLIVIFTIILVICVIILVFSKDVYCEPKIMYKVVTEPILDMQYDEKNKPSLIYNDMFNESSPWIGGYQLGIGKTYTVPREEKKLNI